MHDASIEGLVLELTGTVSALQTSHQKEDTSAARYLTPYRARQIDEIIDAHLDGKLLVSDIAGSLGLSAGYLARAFKASAGKPLYDHITDCRVSRARELIIRTERSLMEIALLCGFSSHAHMTSVFRARLGLTPKQLRAA